MSKVWNQRRLPASPVPGVPRPTPGHVLQPYLNPSLLVTSGPSRFRSLQNYSSREPLFCDSNCRSGQNNHMTAAISRRLSFPVRRRSILRCGHPEMTGTAAEKVNKAAAPKLPIPFPSKDVPLSEVCAILNDRVSTFLQSTPASKSQKDIQQQTEISLGVLTEALERYGLNKVALSYNGGKDCLVLLVLWLVTLHRYYNASPSDTTNSTGKRGNFPESVNTVYIEAPNSFDEVNAFVHYSARQYHLDLCTLASPMKAAFEQYLQTKPEIELIFVGTRRTDPHGSALTHFDPTDGNWPKFMRCHPVIDWHYRDIWEFIRYFEIPYCNLYDAGFTSLGGTEDTHPNPKLRIENGVEGKGDEPPKYRPAYELTNDDEERLGRNSA